ncbi:MAG: methyltransferase domain-containing protein [Candidatus Buchananbacteria bacterium]|jgi:tRNA G10  N-methylase Trm11
MRYIFILGNNPELSKAEILAVLPQAKILSSADKYLVIESDKFDYFKVMRRLGGTIKIGIVLGENPDYGLILGAASSSAVKGKFKFGVSFYGIRKSNFGMKAKAILKERGISARLVESKEDALSSVIVTKEKVQDFLIIPDYFGMTVAIQDWKDYSHRDYDRPAADALSGMLPPKAAKMMINLAGLDDNSAVILDPFCGSGTILSEALSMGYSNLIGSDFADKAVSDTKKNIEWLKEELRISNYELRIEKINVLDLAKNISQNSIDAIITEPFLGKPMRGNEKPETVDAIVSELRELYLKAFAQFKLVLKKSGKLVIVIPEWHIGGQIKKLGIENEVSKLGFKRSDEGNLIYRREDQKVWRNIQIWTF